MAMWLAALAAMLVSGGSLSARQEVAQTVYAKVAPSVVLIIVEDAAGNVVSQGSGFVIDGNLIVTNAHVVRGGTAFVQTGVAKVPCAVSRLDERMDLAVLRAAVPLTAPALRAAPANTPIGTRVYALGNPQGLERTITEGLYTGPRHLQGVTLLQISAPVSPGSSGGPIVDSNGFVVGITVASLETGQNLNFAVPVDTLIALLAQPEAGPPAASTSAPSPTAPDTTDPGVSDSVRIYLTAFDLALRERQAIRVTEQTLPMWRQLREEERKHLASAINASRTDADLLAVHAAANRGHEDIALDAAKIALKRAPAASAWHHLGIAWAAYHLSAIVEEPRKTELLKEARAAIGAGLQMDGSGDAWMLAGQIHGALREPESARAAYDLALKVGLAPTSRPAAMRGLAQAARALEHEADAVKWHAELERAGGARDADRYAHAFFLSGRGRHADAAVLFEALAGNPSQDSPAGTDLLWYSAAFDRWRVREDDAAIAHARRALAAAREEPASVRLRAQAHALIAAILVTRADPLAAEEGRRATEIDPGFGWAFTQHARALNITGRAIEAEPLARRAVELTAGTDSESHFALATSLFFQKRWDESRVSYMRAATLNPADGHAAFNIGLTLENVGRPQEALPWYEEALRRDPQMKERETVRAAIARLKGGRRP